MDESSLTHVAGRLSMDEYKRLDFWREALLEFDRKVSSDLANAPALLEKVPLAVFGACLLNPQKYFPRAYSFLPKMPEISVQKSWTGSSGTILLEQSIAFVQQVLNACCVNHTDLRNAKILDFGVGWGRLIRLFLKYTSPHQVDACDAWEKSIHIAKECNLSNRLALSSPLLEKLPYEANSYDVIYSFSVFTHLSEKAAISCFGGLSKMLKPNGIFVFTVRPSRFWLQRKDLIDWEQLSEGKGFQWRHCSFDSNFGDSTMDIEWLSEELKSHNMSLEFIEWSPVDSLQIICIAKKNR